MSEPWSSILGKQASTIPSTQAQKDFLEAFRSVSSDVTIILYPRTPVDLAVLKLYADEHLPDKFQVCDNCRRPYLYLALENTFWDSKSHLFYDKVFTDWDAMWGQRHGMDRRFEFEFLRILNGDPKVEQRGSRGCLHALKYVRCAKVAF
jgi:hypothetical protein